MKYSRSISPVLVILLLILIIAAFILDWTRPPVQPAAAHPLPPTSTDMAVIGATTAALFTALHGAQNGAQVYLFPQGDELGEDAGFLLAEGLAATRTPAQQLPATAADPGERGEPFSPTDLGRKLREWGGNINDPALLSAFVQFSPRLYPFLESMGGITLDLIPDPEQPYLYQGEGVDPDFFKQQLKIKVMQAGVIISNDRIKELLFYPEGGVKGLLLENNRGKEEILHLRSIVLADGGYSGNLLRWHPYVPLNNMIVPRPGQMGRGLSLAAELGMDVLQAGFYRRRLILFSSLNEEQYLLPAEPWQQAYLFNTRGRLLAWYDAEPQEIFNFIHASPAESVYLLAPQESISPASAHLFMQFENWDSLAEFCAGEVPSFPPPFLPADAHFVAAIRAGVDFTPDGLAVTPLAEVKSKGMIVPGLYAAGEICGGLHGEAVLPGMPLSETLFFSAVAGEAAARHAWR